MNSRLQIVSAKKYHSSWLVAWLSVGVLLGTYGSLYINTFFGLEWLIVSSSIVFIGFRIRNISGVILIIIAGLLFGLWRGGMQQNYQSAYQQYYGKEVKAIGRVSEDPSYSSDGKLKLKLKEVSVDGLPIAGVLWVGASDRASVKRSDDVEVEGDLSEGFGNIPAAIFKARILSVTRQDYVDIGRDSRDYFASGVRSAITEPEASLGTGFLLGQKTALPEKLDGELRLLGLTHIVVASGYNLTILIRFGRRLFARISKFTALAGSLGLIYFFLQITGNSPSMVRASLIATISLVALYYGRKIHPLVLLPVSAAVTVAINPAYAWGDVGWLLSYSSFIGVIMLSPLIHKYFWGDKKPGNIRAVFFETMSAQVWTFPIVAYVFSQYSPLALPANLLVLPLIPLAMGSTAIAGVSGVLIPVTASVIGFPATAILTYMTRVVDYLSQLPLATAEIKFSMTSVIVCYLFILSVMIFMWRRTGYKFREYNIVE